MDVKYLVLRWVCQHPKHVPYVDLSSLSPIRGTAFFNAGGGAVRGALFTGVDRNGSATEPTLVPN